MFGMTTMTANRTKALDAVLSREEAKEQTREVKEWQAAVAEIQKLDDERNRVLTDLRVEENKTQAVLEKLRPAFEKAKARYGYARRNAEAHRYDYSHKIERARARAARVAPQAFDELLADLRARHERLRHEPVTRYEHATGRLDSKGRPIVEKSSDYPALADRLAALRSLCERVELLKLDPCDDLAATLRSIRDEADAICK